MSESIIPECRHILPGGAKCRCVALRGKLLCWAHSRTRTLIETNRKRTHTVALPPLEDRFAIRIAIDEILAALGARKINRREAATYLYAIQMASQNLAHIENVPTTDPIQLCVLEDGDVVAAEPGEPAPSDSNSAPAEPSADPAEIHIPDSVSATDSDCGESSDPCLLDHPNTRASHEYDPELPLPLTKLQLRQKQRHLELSLANYLEARRFYVQMQAGNTPPNENPAIVIPYIQKSIDQVQVELEQVRRLQSPEPIVRPESACDELNPLNQVESQPRHRDL